MVDGRIPDLSQYNCSDFLNYRRDIFSGIYDIADMKSSTSRLAPFLQEIYQRRDQGVSLRNIASHLKERHGLDTSYNAVFSYLKTQDKQREPSQPFFRDLPADIREALIRQLTALWTFDSTSIEGNTLTLGETIKVLELGLTISGKPLKDHEEVYGHAQGVELIFSLMNKNRIEDQDLFDLHRCVMQKCAIDALRPIGNWKRDFNGTNGIIDEKPVYMEYASPDDTPCLMHRWIKEFNRKLQSASSPTKAINVYAWSHLTFVRIHPFFDGNGRIARLIANLPLLRCGHPPLLISPAQRANYIDRLWEYENAVGVIKPSGPLLPPHPSIANFKSLLRAEWQESHKLVQAARNQAAARQKNKVPPMS
jgi:Fic family protein